ncbi:TPA: hypothetical protein ACX6SJ_003767 [Photobacterium damselae]
MKFKNILLISTFIAPLYGHAKNSCKDEILSMYDEAKAVNVEDSASVAEWHRKAKKLMPTVSKKECWIKLPLTGESTLMASDLITYMQGKLNMWEKGPYLSDYLRLDSYFTLAKICTNTPKACEKYMPKPLTKEELKDIESIFK